ncbi:MAG: PD40 domain-containing protein [Bacteroidales bacterium]|nr:PD40 domain-containing protein [Bacteroidales bacterium]
MNRKVYYILAVVLVIVSLFVASRLFATNSSWIYLGSEDYRLVASGNGNFIVFNALQDVDARKIMEARSGIMTDSGVEIMPEGKNTDMTYEEMRGNIIPTLKFYAITAENTLVELGNKETFEIPSPWKNRKQAEGKLKIIRLDLNGKSVLSEDEPEFSQFIPSPDNTKYLLTDGIRDLWLLESDKSNAVKISTDMYNGKTYDELSAELQNYWRSKGADGPATLWWNDNPIFSPDSSKIIYETNRDCMTGGSSIWIFDFTTKEEHPLVKNESGEYYRCDGWIDATHIIVHRYYQNDKVSYFIVDINGHIEYLNIDGKQPIVLSVSDQGLIAYTSNYAESRDIMVIKLGQDGSITELYNRTIGGTLRTYDSKLMSPDGTRIAYLYAPDKDETSQNLVVADLRSGKETIIERVPTKETIYNFSWLDDNRLLIHADKVTNGMHEVSSWIYNIEGGQS